MVKSKCKSNLAGREPNFHKNFMVFWAKHLQMDPTKGFWGPPKVSYCLPPPSTTDGYDADNEHCLVRKYTLYSCPIKSRFIMVIVLALCRRWPLYVAASILTKREFCLNYCCKDISSLYLQSYL